MAFGTVTFCIMTLCTAIKNDTQHYDTGLCRSYHYSHDMVHVDHLSAVRENGGVIENAPVENDLLGEMTFGTITLSIAIKIILSIMLSVVLLSAAICYSYAVSQIFIVMLSVITLSVMLPFVIDLFKPTFSQLCYNLKSI